MIPRSSSTRARYELASAGVRSPRYITVGVLTAGVPGAASVGRCALMARYASARWSCRSAGSRSETGSRKSRIGSADTPTHSPTVRDNGEVNASDHHGSQRRLLTTGIAITAATNRTAATTPPYVRRNLSGPMAASVPPTPDAGRVASTRRGNAQARDRPSRCSACCQSTWWVHASAGSSAGASPSHRPDAITNSGSSLLCGRSGRLLSGASIALLRTLPRTESNSYDADPGRASSTSNTGCPVRRRPAPHRPVRR